uniref:UBC core domain-containing protein n=1 Tax=Piliocolobus tephrosceles TaxID=591936 RepID=A0A8C9HQY1_9PRIM
MDFGGSGEKAGRVVRDKRLQIGFPGIQAEPHENNTHYFHVVIAGPQVSPFEGGTFKLELFLPTNTVLSCCSGWSQILGLK